ncbi:MAG: DNA polymerase III subunit delta' [Acidobacteriaceae bacterium]|jgi:DNA polymerase-3 subunit delta'|nr:DNA polymerase III subunit delta' [Acidobacteriaceae bacterium]
MPFRDIVGHRTLVALLSRSVARGTLPPSLILAGPAGIGKSLAAVSVAQAVNCLEPLRDVAASDGAVLPLDACGRCAACSRIARGVHPDVLLVVPGDNGSIKVDVVRDVVDRSHYRPFEGVRRVVVIDDADALVSQAQNALLKTLEEPPSGSMFILVTSRPDALLSTVTSRCPRLRFAPLAPDDIARALIARGVHETNARATASIVDGSLARALEASEDDATGARERALEFVASIARSTDARHRLEGTKELLAKSVRGATDREMLAATLRVMSSLFRDLALLGTNAEGTTLANVDLGPALERLSAWSGARALDAFKAVDRALAALERNAGVKIVADWLALNI